MKDYVGMAQKYTDLPRRMFKESYNQQYKYKRVMDAPERHRVSSLIIIRIIKKFNMATVTAYLQRLDSQ